MYRRNRSAVIDCLGITYGNLLFKKSINQSISRYVTLKKEDIEVEVLQTDSRKQPSKSQQVKVAETISQKPIELGVSFTNGVSLLKELNQQSENQKNVNFSKATQIFTQIEEV